MLCRGSFPARLLRQHCRGLATLRVAGVPEHFNAPFHLAKERGIYEQRGVDMAWHTVPQGTGEMARQLEEGEVDLAVMLSEGATAKVASGAPLKLVGTYVSSPLRWGIHVKHGAEARSPEDLRGKVFGISRKLSGSHLMAHVFAHQSGWDPVRDAPVKICGTLQDGRTFMASGEIDAWLWEKFTTKHLVDSGEWDIVGEVPTPWPCFLFVASERALAERRGEIRAVIEATKPVCDEFKANAGGSTVAYVAKHHAMSQADATEWLGGTQWACAAEIAASTLEKTQEALVTIGQMQSAVDVSTLHDADLCRITSG